MHFFTLRFRVADGRLEVSSGLLHRQVRRIDPPSLWPRTPPIRVRQSVPDSWLEIIIHEGKNRQVRRMTAAVGLPTLRLLRTAIGDWTLAGLAPGAWRAETVHLPSPAPVRSAAASAPAAVPGGRGRRGPATR